jgi:uncharacterized protein (DUF983 family)
MDGVFIFMAGIAVAANFIWLKFKFDHQRYGDMALDVIIMVLLSFMFTGTASGLAIAMVGGFIISVYLYYSPPRLPEPKEEDIIDMFSLND